MTAKLIKIDRNGSKHYEVMVDCPKCGGVGLIAHHVVNGQPSWNWTDGGVCWKCSGKGKILDKWIERTPEYQAKLDARRKAKADKKQAEMLAEYEKVFADSLAKWGFSKDMETYVFLGNTYEIKDEIKEIGGKFHPVLGWHIDHKIDNFEILEIKFEKEDFMVSKAGKIFDINTDRTYSRPHVDNLKKQEFDRLHPVEHKSEYQGNVKERLKKLELTLDFEYEMHSSRDAKYRGWYDDVRYLYSMRDNDGNVFTWIASSPMGMWIGEDRDQWQPVHKGETVIIDGTVKEHKEYKGEKQTVLTRCKVLNIA